MEISPCMIIMGTAFVFMSLILGVAFFSQPLEKAIRKLRMAAQRRPTLVPATVAVTSIALAFLLLFGGINFVQNVEIVACHGGDQASDEQQASLTVDSFQLCKG